MKTSQLDLVDNMPIQNTEQLWGLQSMCEDCMPYTPDGLVYPTTQEIHVHQSRKPVVKIIKHNNSSNKKLICFIEELKTE